MVNRHVKQFTTITHLHVQKIAFEEYKLVLYPFYTRLIEMERPLRFNGNFITEKGGLCST
jgi:hypothetical protein